MINTPNQNTTDEFDMIDIIDFPKAKRTKKKDKITLDIEKKELEQLKIRDERYWALFRRAKKNLTESQIATNNESQKLSLPKLIVEKIGKRTAIINFTTICERLNRNVAHVMIFFLNELHVPGSLTEKVGFLIKSFLLTERQIEGLFRRYIAEFVRCRTCYSADTKVIKEPTFKTLVMQCANCKASRTVVSLKPF